MVKSWAFRRNAGTMLCRWLGEFCKKSSEVRLKEVDEAILLGARALAQSVL